MEKTEANDRPASEELIGKRKVQQKGSAAGGRGREREGVKREGGGFTRIYRSMHRSRLEL